MGIVAGRGTSPWRKRSVIVPASSTIAVHDIGLDQFRTIAYHFCLSNTTEDKTRSFNMNLQHQDGGSITEAISAKLGNGISYKVSTSVASGIMSVNIENSETFPVTVVYGFLAL